MTAVKDLVAGWPLNSVTLDQGAERRFRNFTVTVLANAIEKCIVLAEYAGKAKIDEPTVNVYISLYDLHSPDAAETSLERSLKVLGVSPHTEPVRILLAALRESEVLWSESPLELKSLAPNLSWREVSTDGFARLSGFVNRVNFEWIALATSNQLASIHKAIRDSAFASTLAYVEPQIALREEHLGSVCDYLPSPLDYFCKLLSGRGN